MNFHEIWHGRFTKIWQHIPVFVKIRKNNELFTWKFTCVSARGSDWVVNNRASLVNKFTAVTMDTNTPELLDYSCIS
jgi:hypothetical protein